MENQNKHIGSFWPIVALCTASAIAGGVIVLALFNYGLENQLSNLAPGSPKALREKRAAHEEAERLQQGSPSTTLGTIGDIANWKTYRNEEYGFEFLYPKDWFFKESTKTWRIQSSSFEKNIHGVGEPPPFELWVDVAYGACNNPHGDYQTGEGGNNVMVKSVCSNNFQIWLSLYNADPNKEEHQEILKAVLSTFKFTK